MEKSRRTTNFRRVANLKTVMLFETIPFSISFHFSLSDSPLKKKRVIITYIFIQFWRLKTCGSHKNLKEKKFLLLKIKEQKNKRSQT